MIAHFFSLITSSIVNRSKIIIRSFFLVILCIVLFLSSEAQVATLDSKKLMATMPVFKKIDTLVQEESQKYAIEYQKKLAYAQRLVDSANKAAFTKSKNLADIEQSAQKAQADFKQYEQMVMHHKFGVRLMEEMEIAG